MRQAWTKWDIRYRFAGDLARQRLAETERRVEAMREEAYLRPGEGLDARPAGVPRRPRLVGSAQAKKGSTHGASGVGSSLAHEPTETSARAFALTSCRQSCLLPCPAEKSVAPWAIEPSRSLDQAFVVAVATGSIGRST